MNLPNPKTDIVLMALRHFQRAVDAGENISYLSDLSQTMDLDELRAFDIDALCEEININNDNDNVDESSMKSDDTQRDGPTYNCAFTIAFQIKGCKTQDGSTLTGSELRAALQKRIDSLDDDEMIEAVGCAYDSYEELES